MIEKTRLAKIIGTYYMQLRICDAISKYNNSKENKFDKERKVRNDKASLFSHI